METRKCRKIHRSLSSETRNCRTIRSSYRRRRESVVKYVGPYRRRRERVVKHVGPALFCCQDYSSHISKKFKTWKKWLLQLKLLCGIAFFWPWAARGLSGSFENVIEFQKSAPLSWSGSFLLITSFKKCTTLVVRLVSVD